MAPRSRRPISVARCIVTAIRRADEVLTGAELAAVCPTSERTFQRRCKELETASGDCLDFIWCARAVLSDSRIWDPDAELTPCCRDLRTRRRLIERGGLDTPSRPTLAQFLDRQQILTMPLLADVRAALQGGVAAFALFAAELSDLVTALAVATV